MKKIVIIAVIAALFTFACGYNFLSSKGDKVSSTADQKIVSVVVAVKDIAPNTTLKSDMLALKPTVANGLMSNFYTSINDVVGSVNTSVVYSGEVLTGNRIVKDKDKALGLSGQLEDGKRAVTVAVDTEKGIANNIKVGNYVDMICVAQIESAGDDESKKTAGSVFTQLFGAGQPSNTQIMDETMGQTFSVIALQNIKVVALDNSIDNYVGDKPKEYTSVTLEVTPAEAAKIALINGNTGKIQLILRPLDDNSTVNEPRDTVLKKTQ